MNIKVRKIFEITVFVFFMGYLTWFATTVILRSLREESQYHQTFASGLRHGDFQLKTQLKSLLMCRDDPLSTETLQHGNYWLLKNLIRGSRSIDMECSESITYTTIGDYTFMGHLGTVVKRWLGPISFALFAPGYDFNDTMEAIQYARNCLPESQLIRDYVSFHIYFPSEHMPDEQVPHTEEEALKWPYDCLAENVPYDNVDPSYMYKTKANLSYPINVGRNIARKAANTHFIFPCDIELYPSLGIIDQFLHMVVNNVSLVRGGHKRRVFPLRVFEMQGNGTLPDTKTQLLAMFQTKEAIPFEEMSCKYCHYLPGQNKWLRAKVSDKMEILTLAKRHGFFEYLEPFYISDNKEPYFDERVTWEGRMSKRIQNYVMCLLDYEYHILHPAFLIHSPGIGKFDPNSPRMSYVEKMTREIVDTIVPEYQTLYGKNKKCVV